MWGQLDVAKHVLADRALHCHRDAVLILDTCFAAVAGEAGHAHADLFVELSLGLFRWL
jgi:hypothetical protein